MKKYIVASICIFLSACSPSNWQQAKTEALDIAKITCIWAHAEHPTSEVAMLCDIANDLLPLVEAELARARLFKGLSPIPDAGDAGDVGENE